MKLRPFGRLRGAASPGCLSPSRWVFLAWLCAALLGPAIGTALGAAGEQEALRALDRDPLRRFLPRSDIYMPVPGGIAAVTSDPGRDDSVETRMHFLHGGLVVGYCLRASCSRVTHLAILQVCNSRIGGLDGSDELILGVVKLPYGEMPGHLLSLQGRNYAENFARYGPRTQALVADGAVESTSLRSIWAEGMGPVAPLAYLGLTPEPQQDPETIALQMTVVRYPRTALRLPRLEVRHFCEQPVS